MSVSYKSQATAEQLQSLLTQRLSQIPLAVVLSQDTDGYPVLSIGTVAAGNQCATIKVNNYIALSNEWTDSLGLAAYPYGPMVIQMIVEQISGNTGTLVLLGATMASILQEVMKVGARLQLYETANATAPTMANIPASPTQVIDPSLQYPLISSS